MNKTEEWYWNELLSGLRDGRYVSVRYEPIALRLADNTTYTPDFFTVSTDGLAEFHETKGTWRGRGQDAARVKIKVAAEMYPEFKFLAILIKNYKITKIEEF